ncbi:MAG: 4Fe-4S dicluster domain-containing protein [Chloroflexi bacterium]|nr:4Fe-4S dicluster domain-containing protein [Chloroflexota bacterium]
MKTTSEKGKAAIQSQEWAKKISLCYQCIKCAAGCPLSEEMDLTPNQVMRALQWGKIDMVLNSRTIWICASCETCTTRCPQGIDIAGVMDNLKVLAQQEGIKPAIPAVPIFCQASMHTLKLFGRMYELGLTLETNIRSGQPLKDARLGRRLFQAGKLKLLPQRARYPRKIKARSEIASDTVAYYPGCSLHSSAAEFDLSTRRVSEKLGLRLDEPEGWVCCGTTVARWTSPTQAVSMPMKNLALIEQLGYRKVTVPCAECFSRLRAAGHETKVDDRQRAEIAREIGYNYQGTVEVQHLVDTFLDMGIENIKGQVTRPLSGLKVACYYGCLLTRPPEVTQAEHPEYPMNMDYLMRALGATTLDWSYKTECCGASLTVTSTETALKLMQRILQNAKEVGAEALVVACPLCQLNLDSRQEDITREMGLRYDLPVFYFTQLMGLALGLEEKDLALRKLLVDPLPLLRNKSLLG